MPETSVEKVVKRLSKVAYPKGHYILEAGKTETNIFFIENELFKEDIHIANWGRKFAESEFLQTEERLISLLFTTASERYMKLNLEKK